MPLLFRRALACLLALTALPALAQTTNTSGLQYFSLAPSQSVLLPTGTGCLQGNGAGTTPFYSTCPGGGSGSVTSIAIAVPAWLTVSGSPVTTSGTITIAAATGQTAHLVVGTGSSGTVGLESLATADLPSTAVTPGSYTSTNLTVDSTGRITAAANGTGGGAQLNVANTWTALQTFGTNISIGGVTATGATGTNNVVFSTSPTLTTPNLGTPSALTLTNATGLPISSGVSGLATGVATFLATPSSANLAAAVTDETGTGALVFGTSPTLVTPALGTPSALVATNATGTAAGLTAGAATNIAGGTANQEPYQTGAGATSFFSASNYGVQTYGATGVPASIAGAAGVLQGSASAIPAFTTTPTLTGTNFTGIPNAAVTGLGTFATQNYATPPAIGGTTPAAGAFTTLSASSGTFTAVAGGVTVGSPTGGAQGAGTLNMAGCYVNGVACGTGGSTAFSSITAGTNTTAAMLVGTGGSLGTTGTGTITASGLNATALGTANTWTALQTFGTDISIGGVTASGATGTGNVVFSASPTFTGTAVANNLTVNGTCTGCSGTAGITQLTGDVTAGPGSGSVPTTVVQINGVAPPTTCTGVASWTSGATPGCTNGTNGVAVANNSIFSQHLTYAPSLTSNAYTSIAGDDSKILQFSNGATATTYNLPVPTTTGFGAGWYDCIINYGTGTVTVTPASSTINGASTLAVGASLGACIFTDGTNYVATGTAVAPSGSGIASAMITWYMTNIASATTNYTAPGITGGTSTGVVVLASRGVTFTRLTYYQTTADAGTATVVTLYYGTAGSTLSASGTLTCTVTLGSHTCSVTANQAVSADQGWDVQIANAGTAATNTGSVALTYQ